MAFTATRQHDSASTTGSGTASVLALRAEGVERAFGKHRALNGISLEVMSGERVALLGPNGAGKTTFVRSICGRSKIDRGKIEIFGLPHDHATAMSRVGMVPQDMAIYGDLTTLENLRAFGRLHGLRRQELKERIDWALEWIGLAGREHQLTKHFSGGMRRRINIACGVMHRPQLILLDEPTVGVDPQSRERIFGMLDELTAGGATIILTTHQLTEAQSQCDRVVVIDHGSVVADGTLDKLVEETIGSECQVFLRIEGTLTSGVPNLERLPDEDGYVASLNEPAIELAPLLHRIQRGGGRVVDLEMHPPSLHDVFLHLTGRELRE